MSGEKVLFGFLAGLFITTAVNADMVSVSQSGGGYERLSAVSAGADIQVTNALGPVICLNLAEVEYLPVGLLPKEVTQSSQTAPIAHSIDLRNEPGSLNMCLYALMGLGLCSSVHLVKKIHLGFIPEWYHDGGPFQIGHSFALSPQSLSPVPAYCFIQPDSAIANLLTFNKFRLRTIMSLWRKSQFTPDVIASRGPPIIQ
jgi:hypothetical protein